MKTFKITYEDNNTMVTGFNGSLEEAKEYYLGQSFDHGDTEAHPSSLMVKVIQVEMVSIKGA